MSFALGFLGPRALPLVAGALGVLLLISGARANDINVTTAMDLGPDGNPVLRLAVPDLPTPAPNVRFVDKAGAEHSLIDFRGKVTAVHFWATWCVPCRAELPQVDALAKALGGPDFEVLPISVDRDGMETVNAFYAAEGIQALPAYLDLGLKAFRAFRLAGVPATIFVDRDGNEIGRVLGERDWAKPEVLDVVRRMIAGG